MEGWWMMEKDQELELDDNVSFVKISPYNTRVDEIPDELKDLITTVMHAWIGGEKSLAEGIGTVQSFTRDFENSGFKDPVPALRAFYTAVDSGVYPPAPIISWLSTAFKKYAHHQGEYTLEDCLGISGHNPFRLSYAAAERAAGVRIVAKLVGLLNLKPGVADDIVATLLGGEKGMSAKAIENWRSGEYRTIYKYYRDYFSSLDGLRRTDALTGISALSAFDPDGRIDRAVKQQLAELCKEKNDL